LEILRRLWYNVLQNERRLQMGFNNGYDSGYSDCEAENRKRWEREAVERYKAENPSSGGGSPDAGFDPVDPYSSLNDVAASGLTSDESGARWEQDFSGESGGIMTIVDTSSEFGSVGNVTYHLTFPSAVTRIVVFWNAMAYAMVAGWNTTEGHEITRTSTGWDAGGSLTVTRVSPDTVAIFEFKD
jgi:hypothetical protein